MAERTKVYTRAVSVRLTPYQQEALRRIARRDGVDVTDVARMAIDRAIETRLSYTERQEIADSTQPPTDRGVGG